MSPIGRVFIVLNLILAAGFVVMAGTFLQHHTDYKSKYDGEVQKLADAVASHDAQRAEHAEELSTLQRNLRGITASLETAETGNKALTDENGRLKSQLADLAGDVKGLNARATTMADAIERATKDARNAYEMAMAATAERDQANREKEAAQAQLSEAGRQATELEATIASQSGQIAALDQTTKEQQVIFDVIKRKAPGIFDTVQPDLRGVVEQAEAGICTVRLTENPGGVQVRPGWTFAIHNGGTYKGEAMITSVDGEFAFCKVTRSVDGMTVSPGDDAATNVGS